MAKPLGPKSLLIRDAIRAHPGKGNTELAEMINSSDARREDRIKVTAQDVAQQRQALKKAGEAPAAPAPAAPKAAGNGRKKPGRKPGRKPAGSAPAPVASSLPTAQAGPIALIDKTLDLAQQCGGLEQLKRLVDRLEGMRGR